MNPLLSMPTVILALLALLAGAVVPFQAVANATLGRGLGHPLWGTVLSLLVSLAAMLPVLLVQRVPVVPFSQAPQLPAWAWIGGLAGVCYITLALLLAPRLGATALMAGVVAGQLTSALLIDHFGWMGMPLREAHSGRIAGVLAIFLGVAMVLYFTRRA